MAPILNHAPPGVSRSALPWPLGPVRLRKRPSTHVWLDFSSRTGSRSRVATDRGRNAGDWRSRNQISEPHRCSAGSARARHDHSRGTDTIEVSVGARRLVSGKTQIRQSARPRGQFRQRQCIHWAQRPRCNRIDRQACRRSRRVQHQRDPAGLDWRHRRTFAGDQVRQRDGRPRAQRTAGHLDRGRQGNHDHGHVPEGRHGDRKARIGDRRHQWHRQGGRDDRPGYGHDAVIRVHRCAAERAGPAGAARELRSPTRSML